MTTTDARQAAHELAENIRQTGTLPAPEKSDCLKSDKPVMELAGVVLAGINGVPIYRARHNRKYHLTLKAYRWLNDNPEEK